MIPRRPLGVLVAPSGFKEALSAAAVADAMTAGVLRALPDARVLKSPVMLLYNIDKK